MEKLQEKEKEKEREKLRTKLYLQNFILSILKIQSFKENCNQILLLVSDPLIKNKVFLKNIFKMINKNWDFINQLNLNLDELFQLLETMLKIPEKKIPQEKEKKEKKSKEKKDKQGTKKVIQD
eukprot:Anaeramoba_flamelloidesa571606_33.p1 GENE.a571606_33~~a571606_33.p1  ORF type:complete len:123 (+),score=50.47 a571606_33:203-571(+)